MDADAFRIRLLFPASYGTAAECSPRCSPGFNHKETRGTKTGMEIAVVLNTRIAQKLFTPRR